MTSMVAFIEPECQTMVLRYIIAPIVSYTERGTEMQILLSLWAAIRSAPGDAQGPL